MTTTKRPRLTEKERHGRRSTYVHGCHCDLCTEANRKYTEQRRTERYQWTAEHGLPEGIEHGRSAYSNWGCRCDICSAAQSVKNRERYL